MRGVEEELPQPLSVDQFRRSRADHSSPTRTLRLSEQEHSSREPTPLRITIDTLRRPRSNQRTRIPVRYESPLDPGAFRRDTIRREEEERNDGRRITIRSHVGAAVGAQAPIRVRARTPVKSRKQGPSHRKVRRWNNEHFNSLAAEIAALGKDGVAASSALSNATRKAHLYRAVYDPSEKRSKDFERFMTDDKLRDLREKFIECEISKPVVTKSRSPVNRELIADDMMNRIDNRLRRVVVKACSNSYPALKVVKVFEEYIIATCAHNGVFRGDALWWSTLLVESPAVNHGGDKLRVLFTFPGESSTGGFHRLLLHAVAQFHGLKALSKTGKSPRGGDVRTLYVSGTLPQKPRYRLSECVVDNKDED